MKIIELADELPDVTRYDDKHEWLLNELEQINLTEDLEA